MGFQPVVPPGGDLDAGALPRSRTVQESFRVFPDN